VTHTLGQNKAAALAPALSSPLICSPTTQQLFSFEHCAAQFGAIRMFVFINSVRPAICGEIKDLKNCTIQKHIYKELPAFQILKYIQTIIKSIIIFSS